MGKTPSATRVLVLLAAFNGAKWIEEQIDSILRQRDVDVHIIVGDDASTDETRSLVTGYGTERITLISRGRSTGSAAQNFLDMIRTVEAAGFDYIALSDQDDIWLPDKLARAADTLHSRGFAGYSSATTAFWANGKRRQLSQSPVPTRADFLFEGAGQGCTYVLTLDFYCKARNFLRDRPALIPGLHYHDWALYALARAWGLPWVFGGESMTLYRQHQGNDTGAKRSLAGVSKRLNRIANGWYSEQLLCTCRITRAAAPLGAAAPVGAVIAEWEKIFLARAGLERRLRIALFCIRSGRRKMTDRVVLIAAALLGWI